MGTAILATFVLCLQVALPVQAIEVSFYHLGAQSVLLMDANSGEVLYSENGDKKLPVYSVSKMMTAYITLEAIENGQLSWDQEILIDETLSEISYVYAFTNVPLEVGDRYSVEDLFNAMLVQSANAATMALAQTISGSEQHFVKKMNEYAKTLGLEQSQFVSSSGLETEDLSDFGIKIASGGNQMSATDVAQLMRIIFTTYPQTAQITKAAQMWFNESDEYEKFLMTTSNPLLPGASQEIPGFFGGKSGFGGLDGTAAYTALLHDGTHSLISVVIGAMNMGDVYEATRQMMEYGLTLPASEVIEMQHSPMKTQEIIYEFNIEKGQVSKANVDLYPLIPSEYRDATQYTYSFTPTANNFIHSKKAYEAPVIEGQILGTIAIKNQAGDIVKTISVQAEATVLPIQLTWWQKLVKIITELF